MLASVVDFPLPVMPVTSIKAAHLFGELFDYRRQVELFKALYIKRDYSKDYPDRAALHEDVYPESSHPGDAVSEVHLVFFLKGLFLRIVHYAEGDLVEIIRLKGLKTLEVYEFALEPDYRRDYRPSGVRPRRPG